MMVWNASRKTALQQTHPAKSAKKCNVVHPLPPILFLPAATKAGQFQRLHFDACLRCFDPNFIRHLFPD
jgi:hypothetical protein